MKLYGRRHKDGSFEASLEAPSAPPEDLLLALGWERHSWLNRFELHAKAEVTAVLAALGDGGEVWAFGPPEHADDGSLTLYVRRVN